VRKTFKTAGRYVATLTVIDNLGASATDSVAVQIDESTNVLPTADAGGPYPPVTVGSVVALNASNSRDPDGTIVRYDWQFGDGTSSTGSTSPLAFKTYSVAGTYIVGVTVFDNRGGVSFDTAMVTVRPLNGTNHPPVAKANGPYAGTVGLPVTLK